MTAVQRYISFKFFISMYIHQHRYWRQQKWEHYDSVSLGFRVRTEAVFVCVRLKQIRWQITVTTKLSIHSCIWCSQSYYGTHRSGLIVPIFLHRADRLTVSLFLWQHQGLNGHSVIWSCSLCICVPIVVNIGYRHTQWDLNPFYSYTSKIS